MVNPCDMCGETVSVDDEKLWGDVIMCPACDGDFIDLLNILMDEEDKGAP